MHRARFHTLVLGGGKGTRLGELGARTPKPLLGVCGKPVLGHILGRVLALPGAPEIVILINTKFAPQYEGWLAAQNFRSRVTLVNNEDATDGRFPDIVTNIALTIERLTIDTDLLIVGGDNYFDFSLDGFVAFARPRGLSTIVVDIGSPAEARRFAVVSLDDSHRITRLAEKPAVPDSTLVTTCIFWVPRALLGAFHDYSVRHPPAGSLGQFLQWLTPTTSFYGYRCAGPWHDIGTREEYEALACRR